MTISPKGALLLNLYLLFNNFVYIYFCHRSKYFKCFYSLLVSLYGLTERQIFRFSFLFFICYHIWDLHLVSWALEKDVSEFGNIIYYFRSYSQEKLSSVFSNFVSTSPNNNLNTREKLTVILTNHNYEIND